MEVGNEDFLLLNNIIIFILQRGGLFNLFRNTSKLGLKPG